MLTYIVCVLELGGGGLKPPLESVGRQPHWLMQFMKDVGHVGSVVAPKVFPGIQVQSQVGRATKQQAPHPANRPSHHQVCSDVLLADVWCSMTCNPLNYV